VVYIGTSGYSYEDWVGPFYPPGTPSSRFLDHYARVFGCVEVNYTYYRMPNARTLGAMAAKTGPDFRFVVKAPGELTHEGAPRPEGFAELRAALQPLLDAGKFGGVLAQFPWSFRPSEPARDLLQRVREGLSNLPVVIEFRNSSWVKAQTFALLRELGLGYCCVDEPRMENLMPPIAEVTSDVGYVRFHGRNAQKWFRHEQAWERYNYLYSAAELAEWVGKVRRIAGQAQDTYVFFNNHYNAQAVQNARLFTELLDAEP
jgi:uncharacterized protein YecE (DUF72 family)